MFSSLSKMKWVLLAWLTASATATYAVQHPMVLWVGSWVWYIYIYMGIMSTAILLAQISPKPLSNRKFVTRLYGTMAAKLFLSLILVFVLIKIYPEERLDVAITFFIYYLLFTAFEMLGLLANLRAQN